MANLCISRKHIIAMGLYCKHMSNLPVSMSIKECKNYEHAYVTDPRRPLCDFMDNRYVHDFRPLRVGEEDDFVFDLRLKAYVLRPNITIEQFISNQTRYDANGKLLTNQIISYLEILGKERAFAKEPDEPIA